MDNYLQNDQEYQKYLEEMNELVIKGEGTGAKVNFFKFEKESAKPYIYRVLPSKIPGKQIPVVKMMVHYGLINPNTGKNGAFPCLSMWGKECPICRRITEMESSPDFELQAKGDEIKPSTNYLMSVVNMYTNEVGVLQFYGKRSFESISGKLHELYLEGVRDPGNVNSGVVLQITKTGRDQNVRYSTIAIQKNHKLDDSHLKGLEDLPILSEVFGIFNIEDYEKVIRGEPFSKEKNNNVPPQSNKGELRNNYQQQIVQGRDISQPSTNYQENTYKQSGYQQKPTYPSLPTTNTTRNVNSVSFPNPNKPSTPPTVEELQRMLNSK